MADLFVSSVEGSIVGRLGTRTSIGVVFDAPERKGGKVRIRWTPDEVTRIPEREYAIHRRHYDRALTSGQLRRRTPEDYDKAIAAQTAASEKAAAAKTAAKAKQAELAKRAEEAAKAVEAEGPPGSDDDSEGQE